MTKRICDEMLEKRAKLLFKSANSLRISNRMLHSYGFREE